MCLVKTNQIDQNVSSNRKKCFVTFKHIAFKKVSKMLSKIFSWILNEFHKLLILCWSEMNYVKQKCYINGDIT